MRLSNFLTTSRNVRIAADQANSFDIFYKMFSPFFQTIFTGITRNPISAFFYSQKILRAKGALIFMQLKQSAFRKKKFSYLSMPLFDEKQLIRLLFCFHQWWLASNFDFGATYTFFDMFDINLCKCINLVIYYHS